MRRLLPALLIAAILPAGCGVIHNHIYYPPHDPLTAADLPAGGRLITVTTRDGLRLTGAAVPASGDRPTLLIFHGNAASAASTLKWFAPLITRGYGVVAAEYRGYAGNPGRPDERRLEADADAFYAEAERLAAGRPVFVIGHSLGGGVAFGLAGRHRLDALITVGTFTRLRAMAPRIVRAFVGDRFDNLAAVASLDEPLFLIHGTADETVSATQANKLIAAARVARKPGAAFIAEGAGHRPDAATIDAIVEAIDARVEQPGRPAPPLPAGIRAYPLG